MTTCSSLHLHEARIGGERSASPYIAAREQTIFYFFSIFDSIFFEPRASSTMFRHNWCCSVFHFVRLFITCFELVFATRHLYTQSTASVTTRSSSEMHHHGSSNGSANTVTNATTLVVRPQEETPHCMAISMGLCRLV